MAEADRALAQAGSPQQAQILALSARTCILVLGMHRSGTSAVCGVLSTLGAERPVREMSPAPDNAKGFFEPSVIVDLHDELLASAGSRWSDWDPLPASWHASALRGSFVDRLLEAARHDFPGSGAFLLKDPRTCRLTDIWFEVLARMECRPLVLLQYREPLEVALSLKKRNGLPLAEGLLIWLRHILESERASRGQERSFVDYAAILLDWQSELGPVISKIRPALPKQSASAQSDVERFLDDDLRHYTRRPSSGDEVHPWITGAIRALRDLRDDPDDQGATVALDAIKAQFDRACAAMTPAFHGSLLQVERLQRDRTVLADEVAASRNRSDAAERDLAAAQAALAASQPLADRAAATEAELEAARQTVAALSASAAQLTDLQVEAGQAQQRAEALAATAERVPALEQALLSARQEIEGLKQELVLLRLQQTSEG